MPVENFDYRKYREGLAEQIKKEPVRQKRREVLETARETEEYETARILHRAGGEKERRRLRGGGFFEESEAFGKVVEFAKLVQENGGRALLVGGSVRDEVMGIPPKDYDVEVYGITPEKLKDLAGGFGQINEVGVAFGILKMRIGGIDIDVSLPRRESKIGVRHKDFKAVPDSTMSMKEAARRRDFTFNALAKDAITGNIYDYFGGIKDIEQRILRVTDEERFKDDPLRVLRGVQFVARFGLQVEDRTAAIMREMRSELRYLPKERLREEWIKLFLRSRKPSLGLHAAMEWGIFHEMHPEVVEMTRAEQEPDWHPEGDAWIHTLMVVDEAARIVEREGLKGDEALTVMLAAFCHDFGKPLTTQKIEGMVRSLGHEEAGAEPANKFLSEIGIEPSLRGPIAKLVAEHLKPSELYIRELQGKQRVNDGTIERLAKRLSPATLRQLVCVAKADHLGRGPFVDPKEPEKSFIPIDFPAGDWLLKRASDMGVYDEKPKPILFGRDLIALGFPPNNPLFGKVIRAAEEMHEKGLSREEILLFISSHKEESLEDIAEGLKKQRY